MCCLIKGRQKMYSALFYFLWSRVHSSSKTLSLTAFLISSSNVYFFYQSSKTNFLYITAYGVKFFFKCSNIQAVHPIEFNFSMHIIGNFPTYCINFYPVFFFFFFFKQECKRKLIYITAYRVIL